MATIITKNGSGSAVPSSLIQGELAINVDAGTLYYGSGSANAVRTITASYAQTASFLPVGTYNITSSWATNAITSSYPISVTGSTLFSTSPLAGTGFTDNNSVFLGADVAADAAGARFSVFIGNSAGKSATAAQYSNFIGLSAGEDATNANDSNFLGNSAGSRANNASYSNFLGVEAGASATDANDSNFLGTKAGKGADKAAYSNFLGVGVGENAVSASYSTLIGYQVGYNSAGLNTTSIGSNNIIIGTNITLPDQSKDSINLGAIIFATGSYSTITGNPFSGSIAPSVGKVGINKVTPLYNLDVSGSGNFSNNLTVTGSTYLTGLTTTSQTDVLTYNSTTGQVFFTASSAIGGGGGGSTVKAGSGSAASFGGSPLTSSITFGSAFSDNLYAVTITGEDARSWTIQSKSNTGFTINSNSSTTLTGPVYWIATPFSS